MGERMRRRLWYEAFGSSKCCRKNAELVCRRRINYDHRPIGVILLESTEPLGVNSKTLDKLGADGSLKVLVEVLTEILHVVRGSFDVDRPQS